ncbi:MAG: large conductance mechanosensitive channel protein MscL [Clostridiales bacterium]|nr:large conductance mechanosensitive channel protein MscL [Clostridiales bacterium]
MAKHRKKIKERLSVLEEFKKFILRGNVIDLAVGVIIGGAFNKIVTSLVNDILMPFLSIISGAGSLSERFIALDFGAWNAYASADAAAEAGVPILRYGSFLVTVLDFLLMGFVIFLLVKLISFLRDKFAPKPESGSDAPAVKDCPFCFSKIHMDATVCPYCTSKLNVTP